MRKILVNKSASGKDPKPGPRERVRQKARTREELVRAAKAMAVAGNLPSVAEAARAANVSIATAYRYFPNPMALLGEALEGSAGEIAHRYRPRIRKKLPAGRRVGRAAEDFMEIMLEREDLIRATMGLSLMGRVFGPATPAEAVSLRPGFRWVWIDQALEPDAKSLDPKDLRLLRLALGVLIGSEAWVALTDVAGVSREEALEIIRWSTRTLVEAVLKKIEKKRKKEDWVAPSAA